jgi:hypothetical protein
MCAELKQLLDEEQEAIRRAEDAIHHLDGPQPVPDAAKAAAEQAVAERIATRERVSIHRTEHGC